MLGATRENLTGVRVIRAFGREEAETQRFEGDNNALTRLQEHVGKVSALMNPVTYVIINLATVVLIWVGALRVDTAIITQGAVVALINYMSQILVELIKLANLIINITRALACMGRVQSVLDTLFSKKSSPWESPDRTKYKVLDESSSLWQLAYEEYGDADEWKTIARFNGIRNPLDIRPGMTVVLPPIR